MAGRGRGRRCDRHPRPIAAESASSCSVLPEAVEEPGCVPRRLITDKLRSYPTACRRVMPSVVHCTDQYANNRAEVSHQPIRQRERHMRRFKSAAQPRGPEVRRLHQSTMPAQFIGVTRRLAKSPSLPQPERARRNALSSTGLGGWASAVARQEQKRRMECTPDGKENVPPGA